MTRNVFQYIKNTGLTRNK